MIHLSIFFAIAFLSGLFYPVFYAIIGSPEFIPNPEAPQFEDARILGISKPGMIFRWYGAWLCRKQNEWEATHDKSRNFVVKKPDDAIGIRVDTSYGRTGLKPKSVIQNESVWGVTLLPGELATLNYRVDGGLVGQPLGKEKIDAFTPTNPNFDRLNIPLSIFKALGLCGACTVFWFMLINLLAGFFIGLFPGWLFWFILPAYGLSIFASKQYEV